MSDFQALEVDALAEVLFFQRVAASAKQAVSDRLNALVGARGGFLRSTEEKNVWRVLSFFLFPLTLSARLSGSSQYSSL